ncbi:DUF4175 family protein [Asticcacaulis benevestitus]|uniref:DUF4175 domain-containing protein n=1 Tax=Asticcacaulis benevestitus DSM 16100 = ATCC BAA-896 TaxID=1121022 RepID=V4Q1X4_9CAUL|nr:DUF4175 family protein [Asticcacaulis benevestitus]ESQ93679.1 hypothetical protein ABENE_05005 [Asticcacaulis benevestitus DSM 16100 = ATCC BAA-896]
MSSNKSPLAPLNRGLFFTKMTMIWERLVLPFLFPYVLLVLLIVVAGQWGLFAPLPRLAHLALLGAGLVLAVVASVRAALRFRMPTFTEINTRLAVDNALRPERLLAMRHEKRQPPLKIGKAKAGIAASDPLALRYVALAAALLGFLILGPVPVERLASGFALFGNLPQTFASLSMAEK